jgi:transposase-like protein
VARKRFRPEEIIAKLREAEVLLGQGLKVSEIIRQLGIHEVTYYRWRKEYGGMEVDQMRRLKELEKENSRLRRAVSDLTLDKMILKEAAKGNF